MSVTEQFEIQRSISELVGRSSILPSETVGNSQTLHEPSPEVHKPNDSITNWSEGDSALSQRSDITLYSAEELLHAGANADLTTGTKFIDRNCNQKYVEIAEDKPLHHGQ